MCAITQTWKASSEKGSLISGSVPFQVVPFMFLSSCFFPPLISRENSNSSIHPPSGEQERGWNTVLNTQLAPCISALSKPPVPSFINWDHSFPFRRARSCTKRTIRECSQQHYDIGKNLEAAQTSSNSRIIYYVPYIGILHIHENGQTAAPCKHMDASHQHHIGWKKPKVK